MAGQARRQELQSQLSCLLMEAVHHLRDCSPELRRAFKYGNRTANACVAGTLGNKSAGITPTNLSSAVKKLAAALGKEVAVEEDEEEEEEEEEDVEPGGIEDGPQGAEAEEADEPPPALEEAEEGDALRQGIQVLPLPEAQAALRTQLGITVLSDFMSLLTDEDQSCMFYLAEKYRCLHESGTGLVMTEHLLLEACALMQPEEATFVRERLGYIRACHQERAPDCEFRCFAVVLRSAGGRGMQGGHHDTNKPLLPATATQPEQCTVRVLSHRSLPGTPADAVSGLAFHLTAGLHKLLGGVRSVVVSTSCNTLTLEVDARELGLDSGMQHNGYQHQPNVSIMLDRLPRGKAGPRKALTAELVRTLTPLDQLLPTLDGRPRRQVLLERGSSFRPTGGAWDGRQHDPESASYAGGEASKIHLLDTAKTIVEVVPEDDPTAAPLTMTLAQMSGHKCMALGAGLFKDHKGASARGGRARGPAQAQNLLGAASAGKLAKAREAHPTADLPDGMSGRDLGLFLTAPALAQQRKRQEEERKRQEEERGGKLEDLVAAKGQGANIKTLPAGVKPLLDKELWAAWEASGGTALLDPFQLLSKVLKRHPELEKRFTGEQWRVQRRLALRRLGLPESLDVRAKPGEGKEKQNVKRAAQRAAKRAAEEEAQPPKPRPGRLVVVRRVETVHRFPEERAAFLAQRQAEAEGFSLEDWEAAQEAEEQQQAAAAAEGVEWAAKLTVGGWKVAEGPSSAGADWAAAEEAERQQRAAAAQRRDAAARAAAQREAEGQLLQLRSLLRRHLSSEWLEGLMRACAASPGGRTDPLGWLLQLAAYEPAELRRMLPAALRGVAAELSVALADAVQGAAGPC